MYDVVIIGSGPAGLSAAIYGARARLDTLVLEAVPMSGGQILNTYEVDNYPGIPGVSGFELGQKLREHADKLGIQFKTSGVLSVEDCGNFKLVKTKKEEIETRTVILATGAKHRKLQVPGEDQFTGAGVSYCATCDGAFFRNKTVAVVGGGDVALEDAIFLARGCAKVYLIHRRDSFRGAKVLQEQALASEKIIPIYDSEVKEITGNDMVEKVLVYNNKNKTEEELEVNGVFIAVGIQPENQLAASLTALDEQGYIVAGEDCVTSVPGIFAAGDIRTKKLRQVITAAADGANAITSVEDYLIFSSAEPRTCCGAAART